MITHLLFDFNNVILFAEQPSADIVGSPITEVVVPESRSGIFYLNQQLLNFIAQAQRSNIKTAILSASEYSLYRPAVQQIIKPYFNQIFLSKDLGWPKDLPATYSKTAKQLKTEVGNVLFIDDKLTNCTAAELAGMQVIHYQDNQSFFNAVRNDETLQLIKVS